MEHKNTISKLGASNVQDMQRNEIDNLGITEKRYKEAGRMVLKGT